MRGAFNEIAVVAALTAALVGAPSAWALGLGRLSVQSALGESLRAEIDVTSLSPEEASNLRVRVAPPESYRVAGIDYNAILPATAITLKRRPDGTPFLAIASDRAVQEPFVDLILELTWPSGRLLREYTLLFDPPSSRSMAQAPTAPAAPPAPAPAPAPVVAPPAAVAAPAPSAAPAPAPTAPALAANAEVTERTAPAAAAPRASSPRRRAAAPAAAPASSPAATPPATAPAPAEAGKSGAAQYKVRPGDTLSGIAGRNSLPGVSLDQMLVGLYRSNADAFIGKNMNRLRAGVVLNVPTAEEAAAIDQGEARGVIQAQSADFNAYRQRLAAAVPSASEKEPARKSGGRVQTEVQDRKQATAPSPDRLTLDKGAASAVAGVTPEDKLAKERAQKEQAARVQELSRNLDELKKLQAASASANATGPAGAASGGLAVRGPVAPAPVAVAPAPTQASAPAPAPAPAAPPMAAASPVVAPVEAASAVASAPLIAAAASVPELPASTASAAGAAASAPVVAAASAPAIVPAPAEEPSFLDSLSDNPLVLPGAGLVLAILAGLGWYRLRSKNKDDAGVTSFLESRLQPDSFFGASGGQRVDTRDSAGTPSSMSYSLSQIDAIGDVDPVAEADVYLAYGRDLQAEEILKEAMRANPERLAIRTKLLEVYAKRRDTKGFELLAGELYGLTGGMGEDWAKAQELGRSIDPENPLYEPGGAPTAASGLADSAMEPLGASTMPQSVVPSPSRFQENDDIDVDAGDAVPSSMSVDLDISVPGSMDELTSTPGGFQASEPVSMPASMPADIDADSRSLDFDLQDLPPVEDVPAAAPPATAEQRSPEFDMSGLSLDLDAAGDAPMTASGDLASAPLDLPLEDDGGDPLSRKLELAEEFRQIGDLEGARDLLQEVMEKADGALRAKAQGMLDNLS